MILRSYREHSTGGAQMPIDKGDAELLGMGCAIFMLPWWLYMKKYSFVSARIS